MLCGMWVLSSLTRNWFCLHWKHSILTTELPGKSQDHFLHFTSFPPVSDYIYVALFLCYRFCSIDLFVCTFIKHYTDLTACMHVQWLQSCLTICDPMGCSLPVSSVHGSFLARMLQGVATPSSRGSSWVSCIAGGFFTAEPPGKPTLLITVALW